MKRFITLTLVLLMALGLAAPALAYTTNVVPAQGSSPYTVRIYMVEYANVDMFSGWISMPPANRGYATNEIIAFVGELTVPAKRDVWADWYRMLAFTSKNVNLHVTDNIGVNTAEAGRYWLRNTIPANSKEYLEGWADVATPTWRVPRGFSSGHLDQLEVQLSVVGIGGLATTMIPVDDSAQKVYKWLCFGKVTGEDASVTFTLGRGIVDFPWVSGFPDNPWNQNYSNPASPMGIIPASAMDHENDPISKLMYMLVLNEKYLVFEDTYSWNGVPTSFFVYENAAQRFGVNELPNGMENQIIPATAIGDLLFKIETINDVGKTGRMWIYPRGVTGPSYLIHVEPSSAYLEVIVGGDTGPAAIPVGKKVGDQLDPNSSAYKNAVEFYNEHVVNAFGFDAWNRGNLLVDEDWIKMAGAAWDISDTVEVEPWTPYVAVPENIVTDPPKTGEASALGFVMLALAVAAAVVVVRTRRKGNW